MNLKYSVLWFEDNDDWYEVTSVDLRDELDDEGFELDPVREVDSRNIANHLEDRKFDLIVIDLNLDRGEKGSEVIQSLRANNVSTEIVFYSSEGPDSVRRRLLDLGSHFDGVYCIDRDDFDEQIMKVIRTTTKKVEDLNNMRGLMMASLADYDNALNSFLLKLSERNNVHDEVLGIVKDKVEKSYVSQKSKIEAFKEINDLEGALINHNLTSHGRVSVVLSVLKKKKGCTLTKSIRGEIVYFQKELIQERNMLAHVREEPLSNPPKLVGRNVEYTDKVFRDRRRALRRHLEIASQLLELIDDGHFDDTL